MAEVPKLPAPRQPTSILRDPARFEFTQRVAKLYAESKLVPAHLRGNIADCFIALQMADAMDEDPLMVMQNIYIVNARAGWSAQYMIARANRSGLFRGGLRWRTEGAGDSLVVTCYGDLAHADEGDTRVEVAVSMAMARLMAGPATRIQVDPRADAGWRSATWLIRLYCPEVMLIAVMKLRMGEPGASLHDVTPERPALADFTEAARQAPLTTCPTREPVTSAPIAEGAPRRRRSVFSDEVGEVFDPRTSTTRSPSMPST